MNETDATDPEEPGALERFPASQRAVPPPGLEERVLTALRDPARARRLRAEELGDLARRALPFSLLALGLAAALVATTLARPGRALVAPRPPAPRVAPPREIADTLAVLTVPLERRVAGSVWLEAR